MIQVFILSITIVIATFYILSLQRTLNAISNENKEIKSSHLWLLMIPLFNIFYHLYVVNKLSGSISKEILSKGQELKVFRPTYGAGMIASIGFIISTIINVIQLNRYAPFIILSGLCSITAIISGIIYWIQVFQYGTLIKSLQKNIVNEETI